MLIDFYFSNGPKELAKLFRIQLFIIIGFQSRFFCDKFLNKLYSIVSGRFRSYIYIIKISLCSKTKPFLLLELQEE